MLPDPKAPHYHIRWSGKDRLDWQPFLTHAEAEAAALELVQPAESFTVEQYSGDCPACTWLRNSPR
jgi:hypothetical protein